MPLKISNTNILENTKGLIILPIEAFVAMLDACNLFKGLRRTELEVFENDQSKYERLKSLAQTFGW